MSALPSGSVKNAMWQTPVSDVTDERDSALFELRARRRDVLDLQRHVVRTARGGRRPAQLP